MERRIEMNTMVSIVIPVYNSESTIVRTLNSILSQTYLDYEVIAVNDGSSDSSLELLFDFKERYLRDRMQIINQENSGVSKARNIGILKSSGKWIALLDSDDEWLPNKLEVQMRVLKDKPEIDFLGCNLLHKPVIFFFEKISSLKRVMFWELLLKMYPQTSTAIFKKEIIKKVGLYDEAMTHAEDGNFWIRICLECQFYFMPEELVIYGGGKPSFGTSGLAANLSKMHDGEKKNLFYVFDKGHISYLAYIILGIYSEMKYLRRIFIIRYLRK